MTEFEYAVWLREVEGGFIHVGRINKEDYGADRQQVIKDAEALTIKWHSPPYNSRNIETYNGQLLKVVNLGGHGSLKKEYISSNRKKWGYPGNDDE